MRSLLQITCLRPTYSLRRQLMVSYVAAAFTTIGLVVVFGILCAKYAGKVVKHNARGMMKDQVTAIIHDSSKYTADIITERFNSHRAGVELLTEIVRDRIVGYPNDNYEDDRNVPFTDSSSHNNNNNLRHKYPLAAKALPRDWNVTLNMNEENLAEHFQERAPVYAVFGVHNFLSTASSIFHFQGNCNPMEKDPQGATYYPNCSDANNNVETGGVVHPVNSTKFLAEKSAEISIFLKALWESDPDVTANGVFFANKGAGAAVQYPGYIRNSRDNHVSDGCDWLREINPYTGEPLGTEEEIARCHPKGTIVKAREYNPMERHWCAESALHPEETRLVGPYKAANGRLWFLTYGRAIFDRKTGHFIGCASYDYTVNTVTRLLDSAFRGISDSSLQGRRRRLDDEQEQISIGDYTQVALVRVDGTLAAGAGWDYLITDRLQHVNETGFVDMDTFEAMVSVVNWEEEEWTPQHVALRLKDNIHEFSGRVLSAYPIPVPPQQYDPDYRPEFFVLFSIGREVFEVIDEMDEAIDEDIKELTLKTGLIGIGGVTLMIATVWFVSRTITLPLEWISSVASRITNHQHEREVFPDDNTGQGKKKASCLPCKTELVQLVSEFHWMISNFSGSGASEVSNKVGIHEVRNDLSYQTEFELLRRHLDYLRDSKKDHIRNSAYGNAASKWEFYSHGKSKEAKSKASEDSENAEEMFPEFRSCAIHNNENVVLRSTLDDHNDDNLGPKYPAAKKQSTTTNNCAENNNSPIMENSTERTDLERQISFSNHGKNAFSQSSFVHRDVVPNTNTKKTIHSTLFWWIVVLLVFPLLVTNTLICAIVSVDTLNVFPSLVETSESISFDLELESLNIAAAMRAEFVEAALVNPLRDLFLLTRISGWLLFDGIGRSDSFTQVEGELVEECKSYPNDDDESCPVFADKTRTPCDCKWRDEWASSSSGGSCTLFDDNNNNNNTRQLQKAWFVCQASDADEMTGRRTNITSFPELGSTSPETTLWWTNTSRLPGYFKGKAASGYETTYDRLRVISALSVAALPIYNHVNLGGNDQRQTERRSTISSYFAFEADGLLWGYSGCNYESATYSHFVAANNNNSKLIRPDLCPLGKFGYDPRCTEWYENGRRKMNSPVHIAPVRGTFAKNNNNSVVITAGASLKDPRSGEYVGQTRVNIDQQKIVRALTKETSSYFSSLMSTDEFWKNDGDDDTFLIGPKYYVNHTSFTNIRNKMKQGLSGMDQFHDGTQEEENIWVSYYPVRARTLQPVQPNDFARGSNFSYTLLYSLGVARVEGSLRHPFNEIKGDISSSLKSLVAVFLCLISVISVLCILFTGQIAFAVTKPMITLLRIVQDVNLGRIKGRIPPMSGGSREVNEVYKSFAKLYKIGNVANTAFFSGNLDLAYDILSDALQLYRKMHDQKAIGLASNNLGNVLFFMNRDKPYGSHQCKQIDGECCVSAALEHFNVAIEYGAIEFSGAASPKEKAFFAHQLADRYFNRATFYLHLIGDPCCPKNARELGFADLAKARTLDEDAEEFWLKEQMLLKIFDMYFDLLLRRIHGLAVMANIDGSVRNIWDAGALVGKADQLLSAAWDFKSSVNGIGRVARMQQLEAAAVILITSAGNSFLAASLALRMLVEDEYLVDYAFAIAADAVLRYMQQDPSLVEQEILYTLKGNFRRMIKCCKSFSLDTGKCVVFCPEISNKWKNDPIVAEVSRHSLSIYEVCCGSEDYVGLIACDDVMKSSFEPELKGTDTVKQTSMIVSATRANRQDKITCALPFAVHMIASSSVLSCTDTYILHVTDGSMPPDNCIPSVRKNISELNKEREEKVHMLIVGLGLEDEGVINEYEGLGSVSPYSIFINATRDSIHDAFNIVISILLDQKNVSDRGKIQLGIAMETANRCAHS